jgi:hypothetical protein
MAINKATTGAVYGKSTTTAMVTEATTSAASNIYQISTASKRTIDPNVAYSANSTAQALIDTTWMDNGWDLFTGRVKLSIATTVTVSGNYLTMTALASFISWSLSATPPTGETTAIGDAWKSYAPMPVGATLSLKRYYIDQSFWGYVSASNSFIIQIWEDAVTGFWMRGWVTTTNPSFQVDQIDQEAINMQITGPVARF